MNWVRCSDGVTRWGPFGAAGILFKSGDRYYLQFRGSGVDEGDTWGIPGGALEASESPLSGASREVEEELGFLPPFSVSFTHEYAPADDWSYTTIVAEVDEEFVSDSDDWEHGGGGWFTPAEMRSLPLHPAFAQTLPDLRLASASTVTFYHGTNQSNAEAIRRDGFQPPDHHAIANEVEERYGLPRDSIWDHPFYSFNRGFREGDTKTYLAMDRQRAGEYAQIGSEPVGDALGAAWHILEGRPEDNFGSRMQDFITEETAAHYGPAVLTLEVPFSVLQDDWEEHGADGYDSVGEFLTDWGTRDYTLMVERPRREWIVGIQMTAGGYDQVLDWNMQGWFHSSFHAMPLGTVLVPGGEGGSTTNFDHLYEDSESEYSWHPDYVWITDDLRWADAFLSDSVPGFIYRVEPLGFVQQQTDHQYYTTEARIVEVVAQWDWDSPERDDGRRDTYDFRYDVLVASVDNIVLDEIENRSSSRAISLVAIASGEEVGKIFCQQSVNYDGITGVDPVWYVSDIRVDPDWQGLGIATALWEEASRVAASTGLELVHSNDISADGSSWIYSLPPGQRALPFSQYDPLRELS